MLNFVYEDLNRGIIGKKELKHWILMGKYWFQNIKTESTDSDFNLGHEILKKLMLPQEGYSDDFRKWLALNDIIDRDLVVDII
jgi:hypothetical protein